jgi:hypothetical protein
MNRKIAEARPGSGITDQEYYKAFLEDFVNDLVTTVYAGIRGGTIDLNKGVATAAPQEPEKPQSPTAQQPSAATTATPRQTVAQKIQPQLQKQANIKAAGMKNQPMKESSYERLNALFESIIAEQENEGTLQNAIEEFFGEYVRAFGGDYSKYKTQVQGYADKIAKSMQNDRAGLMGKLKGGNHLSKATQRLMFELGNVAYSVYRLKPKGPQAAQAAKSAPAASTSAAPATATQPKLPPEQPVVMGDKPLDPSIPKEAALIYQIRAQDYLEKLKKANPKTYSDLIKSLGS